MSLLADRIDQLEGASIEHPHGLTWPQAQALADAYAAWHHDTADLTATRRAVLQGEDL